jgi:hypothetical protein
MGRMKEALYEIERRDPESASHEPTQFEWDVFKLWVTETYGADMYRSYMAAGWGDR